MVFAKPQYIFNKAIDKLFAIESETYTTIKTEANIKLDINSEDSSLEQAFSEIEKCTLKFKTQTDINAKKEIVDFGLKYDGDAVIDIQSYYNNGELYVYFYDIYDKYIKGEIDEELTGFMNEIFESISEEKQDNTKKALQILKEEIKAQLKDKGEYEKETTEIEIDGEDKKVTESKLIINQKDLLSIIKEMASNLAEDDEFIECFEESPKEMLENLSKTVKESTTGNSDNDLEISIYTKGILNKFVGVRISLNTNGKSEVSLDILKETEEKYLIAFYNGKEKIGTLTIEVEEEKNTKEEQEGTIIYKIDIQGMEIALNVDYLTQYNQKIDNIDLSNSVNPKDITEQEIEAAIKELSERPLIKEFFKSVNIDLDSLIDITGKETNVIDNNIIDNNIINNNNTTTTTSTNEVSYGGVKVKYSMPTGFEYQGTYSSDYMKFYSLRNSDADIQATINLGWGTEQSYKEDTIEWDYDYCSKESDYYKNVKLDSQKTISVGDNKFNYQVLTYDTEYAEKCQNVYVWYQTSDKYIFTIELESFNTEIGEDIIKEFLNITVEK